MGCGCRLLNIKIQVYFTFTEFDRQSTVCIHHFSVRTKAYTEREKGIYREKKPSQCWQMPLEMGELMYGQSTSMWSSCAILLILCARKARNKQKKEHEKDRANLPGHQRQCRCCCCCCCCCWHPEQRVREQVQQALADCLRFLCRSGGNRYRFYGRCILFRGREQCMSGKRAGYERTHRNPSNRPITRINSLEEAMRCFPLRIQIKLTLTIRFWAPKTHVPA